MIIGSTQSAGEWLPAFALSVIRFIGMSCTDEVFSSTNAAIVRGGAFVLPSSRIVSIPEGIAALPSPRRLDTRFSEAVCIARLSRPISGSSLPSSGRTARQSSFVSPAFSATRIIPLQNIIAAATVNHSSAASVAEPAAAAESSPLFPQTTAYTTPPAQSIASTEFKNITSKYSILLINYKFL